MTAEERTRAKFGYYEHHDLPSRYWEPEPDEEDLERMAREYEESCADEGSWPDNEPLPFE